MPHAAAYSRVPVHWQPELQPKVQLDQAASDQPLALAASTTEALATVAAVTTELQFTLAIFTGTSAWQEVGQLKVPR